MNPIGVALDLLLAVLLLAALGLGARLNARLKALRNGQAGFAAAVLELNQAAARAEAGLASLRAASEDTHDALLARIETARALTIRLEQATLQAEKARLASPSPAPASATEASAQAHAPLPRGSLAELAASLKARLGDKAAGETAPPSVRPTARATEARATEARATEARATERHKPRRSVADDDLFEGEPDLRSSPTRPSGLRRSRDDDR
jgi:hypothetical protein